MKKALQFLIIILTLFSVSVNYSQVPANPTTFSNGVISLSTIGDIDQGDSGILTTKEWVTNLFNSSSAAEPSGLEALNETGFGIGWRLIGKNPASYGDVGVYSVDLSQSSGSSSSKGATGRSSFAAGEKVTASGDYSVAMNSNSAALGDYSFSAVGGRAEGLRSVSMGGFAIGENSFSSGTSAANALFSIALGRQNNSSGISSFSANEGSTATGENSFAVNKNTKAIGFSSFSANNRTKATGDLSAAFGNGSETTSISEFAIGSYNTLYTSVGGANTFELNDRLFIIGNGTGSTARSDAFTVLKNGNIGLSINNFEANNTGETLQVSGAIKTNLLRITDLPIFDTSAEAEASGLPPGVVYRTGAGELRVTLGPIQ